MPRQRPERQTAGHHQPGIEARTCAHKQSRAPLTVLLLILFFFALAAGAERSPLLSKIDGTWMLDAEAFAKSEGLSTEWNPIVKRFKAEGKNFKCSFTPGINYFVSNEKTRELGVPARMEGGKLWVPADDVFAAFETALDRRYTADTVALTVTGVSAPAAKKSPPVRVLAQRQKQVHLRRRSPRHRPRKKVRHPRLRPAYTRTTVTSPSGPAKCAR